MNNDFKAIGLGGSARVLSQAAYEALTDTITNGLPVGTLYAENLNKPLRQSTTMAYVLAEFIKTNASVDVLDNGTPATIITNLTNAINALIAASNPIRKNGLINGGMIIAQRAVPNLSTSAQYGQVDRYAVWASTGSVSAGTIAQSTTSPVGRTGHGLSISGATLTGSAVLSVRYRMESRDASRFKNQSASFSILTQHDVGSAVNYTVAINKPTAQDNFTSVTNIATSSAQSVASGTPTAVKLENVSMGDCSYGVEILITIACGAVTTKTFDFSEAVFSQGAVASAFEYRDVATELDMCQRYFLRVGGVNGALRCTHYSAGVDDVYESLLFPTRMRAAPTGNKVGTWTVSNTGQPSLVGVHDLGFTLTANMSGAGGCQFYCADSTTYLTFDSEL
jgi:hypothetical protein